MLLIHWTKQNNISDILKNGIKPNKRKLESEGQKEIKGVWCYPYTRNKSINNNWKRNLKLWRQEPANFNGIVFKLEESDFPIYAGDFSLVFLYPEESKIHSFDKFNENYGKWFSPDKMKFDLNEMNLKEGWFDYQDFEIIIPKRIQSKRIIKVIKDRNPRPDNR